MDACEWTSFIRRFLVRAARATCWTALRLMFRFESYVLAPALIALWRRTDKQHLLTRSEEAMVNISALALEPHQLEILMAQTQSMRRVNIGEFDQDGLLLSKVGPIRGIPCLTMKDFVPRASTTLRLLLLDDSVVVEKDFRGVKSWFVRELTALRRLHAAGCRVPAILDVNLKNYSFTMPFIKGMVLTEAFAKAGAVLRDRDVVAHPAYRGLSPRLMQLKRIEAARNVLANVVSGDFVDKLYRRLQQIHCAGVAHMDLNYGNIVIEEGSNEPRIIDFGSASPICDCGKILFRLLREYDTEQFNSRFGTHYRAHDTHLGTFGVPHSGQQLATGSVVEGPH
jgi:tRNA A-37 threonylcarbamoyl transferase component Bud32